MHSRTRREQEAEAAALRLVQEHAEGLLRFACRFSHCADDAHDAYQRTVEILVRRMRTAPPAQPLSWVRTVLRHEALALRAEREQLIGYVEPDFDRHEGREGEDPAERAVGHERLRQTAEALRRLKPQEVTALVLRSEGLSYREICSRTGWTYTRANRTITEGRRALRERLVAIESGAECERWLPLLSALADGEASADDLAELRPHLRGCPACRATLREFHAAPARVAALVPAALAPAGVAALAPVRAAGPDGSLLDHVGVALHGLADRATLLAARVQSAFEAVPTAKLAAVAASTAALAGGGAALEQAAGRSAGSATHAQATATPAATVIGTRLLTVASPLRAAQVRRSRRAVTAASEFAPPQTGPPEFARRPAGRPEFASAPRAPVASAAVAHAHVGAPTRASATAPPSGPTEFAGP